jgi:hypothetical protein
VSIPGIPNDSDIPLFGGSQLAREHAIEDGETPVGAALTVIYIYTNKVGNRDMMIREEENCRRTTVYSYDANDRLTGSVTTTTDQMLSAFWMPLIVPRRRRQRSRDCEGVDPTMRPLGRRTEPRDAAALWTGIESPLRRSFMLRT